MAINQKRSNRKATGGRYKRLLVRRLHQLGNEATHTKLDTKDKKKSVRTIGGNEKFKLLTTSKANVYNQKTKAFKVCTITSVVENAANKQFVRRNIITKGCVIDTDAGKAKVTSRPGQNGIVNAVLL